MRASRRLRGPRSVAGSSFRFFQRRSARTALHQLFGGNEASSQFRHRHVSALAGSLEQPVGGTLGYPFALHDDSFCPLDHLAVLELSAQIEAFTLLPEPFIVASLRHGYGGPELSSANRLDEVVKDRSSSRPRKRIRITVCGDDHNRNRTLVMDASSRLEPSQIRHLDVEQDQIGTQRPSHRDGGFPVGGDADDSVPQRPEILFETERGDTLIFRNQNAKRRR